MKDPATALATETTPVDHQHEHVNGDRPNTKGMPPYELIELTADTVFDLQHSVRQLQAEVTPMRAEIVVSTASAQRAESAAQRAEARIVALERKVDAGFAELRLLLEGLAKP